MQGSPIRRFGTIAAIVAATLVLAAGCSSSKSSTKKTGAGSAAGAPEGSPAAVLAASAEKTAKAGSAKAEVKIDYASLPGAKGPVTLIGAGEFNLDKKEGHLHLDLSPILKAAPADQTAGLPPNAGDVDIIFHSDTLYMKAPLFSASNPAIKAWIKLDVSKLGKDSGALAQLQQLGGGSDPTQQLQLLESASEVRVAGTETVRGEETTHYTATLDLAKIAAKASAQDKARIDSLRQQAGTTTLPVDVWIDQAGRTRRMQMKLANSGAGANGAGSFTSTVDYFDFGTSVKISVPPDSQVTDLSKLAASTSTSR